MSDHDNLFGNVHTGVTSEGTTSKRYRLQCGAELLLIAVPADPLYPHGQQVGACSSCYSRKFDVPGDKIKELTEKLDKDRAMIREMREWLVCLNNQTHPETRASLTYVMFNEVRDLLEKSKEYAE